MTDTLISLAKEAARFSAYRASAPQCGCICPEVRCPDLRCGALDLAGVAEALEECVRDVRGGAAAAGTSLLLAGLLGVIVGVAAALGGVWAGRRARPVAPAGGALSPTGQRPLTNLRDVVAAAGRR